MRRSLSPAKGREHAHTTQKRGGLCLFLFDKIHCCNEILYPILHGEKKSAGPMAIIGAAIQRCWVPRLLWPRRNYLAFVIAPLQRCTMSAIPSTLPGHVGEGGMGGRSRGMEVFHVTL